MNLKGATALVTGGSNGIGLAIAKTLTEAGAKVAITGRDEKRLTSAAKAIGAHPIRSDVAKEPDVLRTYKEFFQKFDHLDILVNNAGFGVIKPLVEMDLADFERVLATNVTGAMLMAREAVNIRDTAETRSALFAALQRTPAITARLYAPGGSSSSEAAGRVPIAYLHDRKSSPERVRAA